MVKRPSFGRRLVLVATASLVMSACGAGGGGGGVAPPPVTGVSGAVTNTRGGPAVSGATVTATSSMASATTNSQGGYVLALNPGTYDILAAAPGMAASKFQSVTVVANKSTTANLIMFPIFSPSMAVGAPTIAVGNLVKGQLVSGNLAFTVTVTTAAANLPVRRIDVRASNLNALPLTTGALTPGEAVDVSSATFTLTSTALANGPAFVDIIAYDLNQNAAELMLSFTVSNTMSGTAPATPTGLALEAVTTGQSFGLFSTQRARLFSTLGIKQDPNILKVGGRSIRILSAPSNSTLFVEAQWSAVTGATGYKVFRSFSSGGPFVPVAQVPPTQVVITGTLFYDDADPSLGPGVPVFYEVSAFNAGGESAPTAALGVTPLSAFNLNLTSPSNNSTSVSPTPLFTWTPTASVGTDQFYDVVVWGLNDPSPAWETTGFSIVDTTAATCCPGGAINPLQSGKVYQWDIYEAAAQTVYSFSPLSFAVAFATVPTGQGLVPTSSAGGSLNGPFKFTTAF